MGKQPFQNQTTYPVFSNEFCDFSYEFAENARCCALKYFVFLLISNQFLELSIYDTFQLNYHVKMTMLFQHVKK